MKNINFGIDLGTTNSAIGVYQSGKANLLKNPVGFASTMPSVVAYKKERIIVGDKANEQLLSNPDTVFSSFKRRMGTAETFPIGDTGEETYPVELSSIVLKELLNFSIDEKVDSAVITIPASFDTIQSNATKEAGYRAGLREVVLLQEPIAACLAYSNENDISVEEERKWLVYDFGGGTFDAAIVRINERELKVLDNKGNNFLGGVDLDVRLLSDVIIPKLTAQTDLENIWNQINDANNKPYRKLGKYLIYKAEELKKELSLKEEAWLELSYAEFDLDIEIKVTREEFNTIVKPVFDNSFELITALIRENQLEMNDFERIILVGGSTYIPYIREELKRLTGLIVDTSIDPTTAVAIGATWYAGNKMSQLDEETKDQSAPAVDLPALDLAISYESQTQDLEELIAFKAPVGTNGYYRITRNDGGFDTGKVAFKERASEFVTLLEKQVNYFTLHLFNEKDQPLYLKDNIAISHGFYNVDGQPLPNDICLELDAEDETYLELIFEKNNILPLKKTVYKTFSKSIAKGSDDRIVINILEGKVGTLPGANINIGYIEVKGTDLQDDLIKGTDIELHFKISESRDLTVEVYIPGADHEIIETFNPQYQGSFDHRKIIDEINRGKSILEDEISRLQDSEDYERLGQLKKLNEELDDLKGSVQLAMDEILTVNKFQLLEKKRRLLNETDRLILLQDISFEIEDYYWTKTAIERELKESSPSLKREFDNVVRDEKVFLQSGDKYLIRRKKKALQKIGEEAFINSDHYYYQFFLWLTTLEPHEFTDYSKVKRLLQDGNSAMQASDVNKLRGICNVVYSYVKDKNTRDRSDGFSSTGLK